jgi:hypothetical protein
MPGDRMFHVLVLGGIALVAPAGCGDRTALVEVSPGETTDGAVDAAEERSGLPDGTTEEFPSEGAFADGGFGDASGDADAFPAELPVFVDAGRPDRDAGFPIEK